MAHFSLAVILKDGNLESLDSIMEKFDNNKEVEKYINYTKEEAINTGKKVIRNTFEKYNRFLIEEETKDKTNKEYIDEIKEDIRDYAKKIEHYTDEDYYDYIAYDYTEDMIDKEGNLYSTYNPNSKWESWEIGGRWNNYLTLKREKDNYPILNTNVAKIKDIDFDYVSEKVVKRYEAIWEQEVDGKYQETGERFTMYTKGQLLNKYKTKENFIKTVTEFRTHAILTPDGTWHEPIQTEDYFKILDKEKYKDHILYIIDCHI